MNTLLSTLPSLLWLVFAVLALLLFRRTLMKLVDILLWRLRMGAAMKVASFEIGQAIAMDGNFPSGADSMYSHVRADQGGRRLKQLELSYVPNRDLHLVHRVAPSKNPQYAYDVLIYLVPHWTTNATLASVKHVEYYCGQGWKNSIFTIIDRSRSFQLALSTRGPFTCSAEIHFTDGEIALINRYIDGEMLGFNSVIKEQ